MPESRVGSCEHEECGNPIWSRRLCQKHYVQWRSNAKAEPGSECDVAGCDRLNYARGKCAMHYERLRKSLDPSLKRRKTQQGRRHSYARFGLTRSDYAAIMAEPCGICGGPSKHLDHDHGCCLKGCGKCIRGGLCHRCNVGLGYYEGWFRENQEAATAWSAKHSFTTTGDANR